MLNSEKSEHDNTEPTRTAVSRRTLMKTAAGAGVAAATVGIVGVASAAPVLHGPAATDVAAVNLTAAGAAAAAANGPIVVHVADLASGSLEVFTTSTRTEITDHDLAARIARAAGN